MKVGWLFSWVWIVDGSMVWRVVVVWVPLMKVGGFSEKGRMNWLDYVDENEGC